MVRLNLYGFGVIGMLGIMLTTVSVWNVPSCHVKFIDPLVYCGLGVLGVIGGMGMLAGLVFLAKHYWGKSNNKSSGRALPKGFKPNK